MFRLTCNIKIETQSGTTVTFKHVAGVTVSTSMVNFTDTCKLTLPRAYAKKGQNENDITKIFKRNDKITVQLGYDNVLETVFTGYLKSVSTTRPVVIECENESWRLKQIKLSAQHYPKLNVKAFVDEHLADIQQEVVDVDLGEVRINGDTSVAKVFEYFMSNYPLRFFFRDGIFYGVMASALMLKNDAVKTHKFKFGKNIISDNLTYTLAEDVKVQIVAKAILKDNTKIEWKEPASGEGEVRTFLVPGATSQAEVKAFAEETLKTFKVDKMTGSFTAFGRPFVKKGDIVHLFDDDNTERNDKKFLVEAVEYSFGMNGYRQKITLGGQL